MSKIRLFLGLLYLMLMSGCMFMADRKVHVSGTVTDDAGVPLPGATVRFLAGVEAATDVKGEFMFGGVFPGGKLPLTVTKPGFKPYQGSKSFDYYDVTVTLAKETSSLTSKATWKKLQESELAQFQRAQNR